MDAFEVLVRLAEHGTPPDGDYALRISVGLEDTLRLFKLETLPFISGGGAEIRFCYGPYGRGKTHFLRSLQAQARKLGFVTAYVDCKAEKAPFASLVDTYRMLVTNVVPPLDDDAEGIESLIHSGINRRKKGESLISRVRSEGRLELGFKNLVIAYINALAAEDDNLQTTLGYLLRAAPALHFTMSDLYCTYRNLTRPLGKISSRNAVLWIRSLGALPSALNYPGFVVLFDETENIDHLARRNVRQQQQHLANIRNLVDHIATGMFSGCLFYFAVVEEFREIAENNLEALAQRIERIHPDECNPRAIWTSLDELTNPPPDQAEFFEALGDKLTEVAIDAGMDDAHAATLRADFARMARNSAQDISEGAVREFVKSAAAKASRLIMNSH